MPRPTYEVSPLRCFLCRAYVLGAGYIATSIFLSWHGLDLSDTTSYRSGIVNRSK